MSIRRTEEYDEWIVINVSISVVILYCNLTKCTKNFSIIYLNYLDKNLKKKRYQEKEDKPDWEEIFTNHLIKSYLYLKDINNPLKLSDKNTK